MFHALSLNLARPSTYAILETFVGQKPDPQTSLSCSTLNVVSFQNVNFLQEVSRLLLRRSHGA